MRQGEVVRRVRLAAVQVDIADADDLVRAVIEDEGGVDTGQVDRGEVHSRAVGDRRFDRMDNTRFGVFFFTSCHIATEPDGNCFNFLWNSNKKSVMIYEGRW